MCTWAIEAAAIGGENEPNSASTGLPSARADAGAGLRLGKRRDLVAQLPQRLRAVLADQVRACRQELAELDVGGPQAVERRRQPFAAVHGGDAAPFDEAGDADRRACPRRQIVRIDEAEGALARQNDSRRRPA